jgi:hypothetical protein
MQDWEKYSMDSMFAIAIPPGTKATIEDDDTMVVLTLLGEPKTDILIGLFPLDDDETVTNAIVMDRLLDFIDRCVHGVTAVKGRSVQPAIDNGDKNFCVWQAVAEIDDDHWWLARLYGRYGGSNVMLVHWNGPKSQMIEIVLKAFVSLEPLFARNDQCDSR